MNNGLIKKALMAYQSRLYKEITFHGMLGNEEIKQALLNEVWKVEDEIESLKKQDDIPIISEA